MADCTVKNKKYGYWCGNTGTAATVVTNDIVQVKGLLLVSGGSARTLTVTDKAGDTIVNWVTTASGESWIKGIPLYGSRFDGLKVTIGTDTTDRVLIFTV